MKKGIPLPVPNGMLDEGGEYAWRKEAEYHQLNPTTIALLQHATRSGNFQVFTIFQSGQ
jgi:glutamate synthase (NADPH/NADH) large chain